MHASLLACKAFAVEHKLLCSGLQFDHPDVPLGFWLWIFKRTRSCVGMIPAALSRFCQRAIRSTSSSTSKCAHQAVHVYRLSHDFNAQQNLTSTHAKVPRFVLSLT